jgi:arylsulfatase A-like enzyme/predicted Zn-dependent protease
MAKRKDTKGPNRGFRVAASIFGLVLVAGGGVYYWSSHRSHGAPIATGSLKDRNVLLITLDTTRADHLPAYGYKNVKTPGLDRLADTSLIFDDAIAQVPLTLPSHTSILTGQLPVGHGVRDNEGYLVDPKATSLAAILKAGGYTTAAFVSAFVLDSRFGLNQGFDSYFDHFNGYREVNRDEIQRTAEETEAEVEKWLPANKDKRFFCWVHFYDPHEPYDPPEPYATTYAANRYDGEIAYMDRYVGKLLAKLDELRLADRTLVIVTGDHGEGLGEHDETTHAMFLYSTTLRVPLLIRVPGGSGRRIPGIVRHIDLAPTVLDLLGFPPSATMQGSTLVPVINGTETSKRVAYSESLYAELHYGWSPLKSVTTERYAFIESPKSELFDRRSDPRQLHNLIQEQEAIAKDLRDELHAITDQFTRKDLKGPQPMDAEAQEKLRSLGYLGSPAQSTAESLKVDPKDMGRLVSAIGQGFRALSRRDFQEALRLVVPVVEADPKIVDAHLVAGAAYSNLQQYDKALQELMVVLAARPEQIMALATVGATYDGMGNLKEAERWYLKVFEHDKAHAFTTMRLASLYRRMGDSAKADEYFSRAMKPVDDSLSSVQEPGPRSRLYAVRAELEFRAGKFTDAETDLKAAIALTPQAPDLHFNLAQVYEEQKDVPRAVESYQAETAVAPRNFGAQLNLGLIYFKGGRVEEASACFQKLLELRPGEPRASFLLAETYNLLNRNLDEALRLTRQGLALIPDNKRGYALMAELLKKLGRDKEADEASAMAARR